jgi:hypothetical protein
VKSICTDRSDSPLLEDIQKLNLNFVRNFIKLIDKEASSVGVKD